MLVLAVFLAAVTAVVVLAQVVTDRATRCAAEACTYGRAGAAAQLVADHRTAGRACPPPRAASVLRPSLAVIAPPAAPPRPAPMAAPVLPPMALPTTLPRAPPAAAHGGLGGVAGERGLCAQQAERDYQERFTHRACLIVESGGKYGRSHKGRTIRPGLCVVGAEESVVVVATMMLMALPLLVPAIVMAVVMPVIAIAIAGAAVATVAVVVIVVVAAVAVAIMVAQRAAGPPRAAPIRPPVLPPICRPMTLPPAAPRPPPIAASVLLPRPAPTAPPAAPPMPLPIAAPVLPPTASPTTEPNTRPRRRRWPRGCCRSRRRYHRPDSGTTGVSRNTS